jgi:hypothetical protein
MRRTSTFPLTFLLPLVAVAGCMADRESPTAPVDAPFFAKGKTDPNPTATWLVPVDDAGLALRSDGQFPDGPYSAYANGVCGVGTTIFVSGSGDATIQTDKPKGKGCGRRFVLAYPDGFTESVLSFNNVRELHKTTETIPIGATVRRTFAINPGVAPNNPSRCDRLLFGLGRAGLGMGSDSVEVTRVDPRTWHVRSQPPPDNRVLCEKTGEVFEMTVDFRVVANQNLP